MNKKEPTRNYDIMFKSAVSMLQLTYAEFVRTKREKFEFEYRGWFDDKGNYCVTSADEGYEERLAEKEHYQAEQVKCWLKEVERLRNLK